MQNRGWKIKDGVQRSKSKRIYPAEEASGPGENLQVNEVSRRFRRYSSWLIKVACGWWPRIVGLRL